MKRLLSLVFVGILVMSTSCATLFNGKKGKVQVKSNPTGAAIYVDGKYMGVTPKKLKLDNKEGHTLVLKSGTQEATYTLESKFGVGWVFLDVVGSGLIGLAIDAGTGAWYSLKPNKIDQTFDEEPEQLDNSFPSTQMNEVQSGS